MKIQILLFSILLPTSIHAQQCEPIPMYVEKAIKKHVKKERGGEWCQYRTITKSTDTVTVEYSMEGACGNFEESKDWRAGTCGNHAERYKIVCDLNVCADPVQIEMP